MHIRRTRGWDIPDHLATPEEVFLNRRALLGGAAGLAAGSLIGTPYAFAAADPTADLYPAKRNESYVLDREVTAERFSAEYNNFYEFGTDKSIHRAAQRLPVAPWSIKVDGLVEKPGVLDLQDLLKQVQIEERIYRHRCVEGWAMTVPWTGFALKDLVRIAAPLSSAQYVEFETLADKKTMPGLRAAQFNWPYIEGLTLAEATNDLAFIATGLYGKTIPPQNGAPLRLVVPWKYGFKSIKSIVRVTFTDKRPSTFWEALQPAEYGFWANVNPDVPHPRWSQATERLLGSDKRVPTRIFNGYGEQVAGLYAGLGNERLYV